MERYSTGLSDKEIKGWGTRGRECDRIRHMSRNIKFSAEATNLIYFQKTIIKVVINR